MSRPDPIFVIQEHAASHLHWDFRLERDGVLKSWAVPKGPPEEPGIRRLAMEVEDHPLDYASFEGTIPEGRYGAGKVTIWDKGEYRMLTEEKGFLEFILRGKRLSGRYKLVKFGKAGPKSWLILKAKDEEKKPRPPARKKGATSPRRAVHTRS
jgi:DNA ligase D-like protein (predicted 3'-phosphoesterase)